MTTKKDNFKIFIETLTQFDTMGDPVFCVQPVHDYEKGQLRKTEFFNVSKIDEVYTKLNLENQRGFCLNIAMQELGLDEDGDLRRRTKNCKRVRAFCIDFDYYLPLDFIKKLRDHVKPSMIVLSSKKPDAEAYKSHFYLICETNNPDWNKLNLDRYKAYQKALATRLGEYVKKELNLSEEEIVTDAQIIDLPRAMRAPGFLHQKNLDNVFEVKLAGLTEDYLTESNFDERMQSLGIDKEYAESLRKSFKDLPTIDNEEEFFTPDPEARNQTLFHHACTMFREGRHYDEVRYSLLGIRDEYYSDTYKGKEPIEDEELDALLESAHGRHLEHRAKMLKQGAKSGDKFKAADFLKDATKDLVKTKSTFKYDFSNRLVYSDPTSFRSITDRFRQRFGSAYKNVDDTIYRYREADGIWAPDDNTILEKYYTIVDDMKTEPAVHNSVRTNQGNIDEVKVRQLFNRLQGHKRFKEFQGEIKATQSFLTPAINFDTQAELLNCHDGVIDLKNKTILPHSSDLLMTQQADTGLYKEFDYIDRYKYMDQEAWETSNIWTKFLWQCANKDLDLVEYLQRCLGYLLEANNKEQVLLFFYGTGSNGKSLTLEVLARVLGTYAGTLRSNIWKADTNSSDTILLSELNNNWNKRFVVTSECPKQISLNEEAVKRLTGETKIDVKKYHQDIETRETRFTPIIMSNYSLNVQSGTDGIWRRIALIPYSNYVDPKDVDPELMNKLCTDKMRPEILAWLIAGNQMYREKGLAKPESVLKLQRSYRLHSLSIREFIQETMVVNQASESEWLSVKQIVLLHNKFKGHFSGNKSITASCDPNTVLEILKSLNLQHSEASSTLGRTKQTYNLKLNDEYSSLLEDIGSNKHLFTGTK